MSIRRIACFVLAALTAVFCLASGGCAPAPVSPSDAVVSPAEPEIVYENVPEEYRDLFHGGSFDEYNIWTTDDGSYSALMEKLRQHCDKYYNGSLLLATDEKILFAGGWDAKEIDGETIVNPFTTYEIGSVTKQICAAAILQQVQAGKIDVNETIEKYFPDYPYSAGITVDDLLHMQTGIPDIHNDRYIRDVFLESESFQNGSMSDEEILSIVAEYELNTDPSAEMGFMYSNTNYLMLAIILEQVTGQSYEEYIENNLFAVCDMPCSTCCETGGITSVPEMGAKYWSVGRGGRGYGDIHSNVCDILRWDRTLLDERSLLDDEQMEYMLSLRNGYSCGWQKTDDNCFGHSGGTYGYTTYNSVYTTSDGERMYLIQMSGNVTKSRYGSDTVFEIMEKNLP